MLLEDERDDRCDHDLPDNHPWFVAQCREHRAQIANDMQAIMALVEETMLRWDREGWLCRRHGVHTQDADGKWIRHERDLSPVEAASHVAECVQDSLVDAWSDTAREAWEVGHP